MKKHAGKGLKGLPKPGAGKHGMKNPKNSTQRRTGLQVTGTGSGKGLPSPKSAGTGKLSAGEGGAVTPPSRTPSTDIKNAKTSGKGKPFR